MKHMRVGQDRSAMEKREVVSEDEILDNGL